MLSSNLIAHGKVGAQRNCQVVFFTVGAIELLSFYEIISTAIFLEGLTFVSGVCLLFGLEVKYNFHRNSASLIALCMLHKNMECMKSDWSLK